MLKDIINNLNDFYCEVKDDEIATLEAYTTSKKIENLKYICHSKGINEIPNFNLLINDINNSISFEGISFINTSSLALTPSLHATTGFDKYGFNTLTFYVSLIDKFWGIRLTLPEFKTTIKAKEHLNPELFNLLNKLIQDYYQADYLDEKLGEIIIEDLIDLTGNKLSVFDALFSPLSS